MYYLLINNTIIKVADLFNMHDYLTSEYGSQLTKLPSYHQLWRFFDTDGHDVWQTSLKSKYGYIRANIQKLS